MIKVPHIAPKLSKSHRLKSSGSIINVGVPEAKNCLGTPAFFVNKRAWSWNL